MATNGHVYVKEVALDASWHDESATVAAGALCDRAAHGAAAQAQVAPRARSSTGGSRADPQRSMG